MALLLIGVIAAPSSAQASQFALFLGKSNGTVLLYRADLSGAITPLSKADSGDVQLFQADSNGAAFIAGVSASNLTLNVVDISTKAITTVPLAVKLVSQLVLTDSAVELATTSSDGKPTLMTFNRADLKPIAQQSTQHTDSIWMIQAGGSWALAYNVSGALDVFSLPDLKEIPFTLVDKGYSAPSWSPAAGQLQLIGSSAAQPDNHFIYLIDFDNPGSKQFALPAGTNDAQWSSHGHYVVSTNRGDTGTLVITSVADGSQQTLSEPGFVLVPLSWSYDDQWMFYTAQINAASPVDLFAYNVTTGDRDIVHMINETPISSFWATDSDQAVVLAQASDNSIGLYTVTAPKFDSWTPLISTANGPVVNASIAWRSNTVLVEYAGALLSMDLGTRAALRLTPVEVQIVPGSEQLIG